MEAEQQHQGSNQLLAKVELYRRTAAEAQKQAKEYHTDYLQLFNAQDSDAIYNQIVTVADLFREVSAMFEADQIKSHIKQIILNLVHSDYIEEGMQLPLADLADLGLPTEELGMKYELVTPTPKVVEGSDKTPAEQTAIIADPGVVLEDTATKTAEDQTVLPAELPQIDVSAAVDQAADESTQHSSSPPAQN